MIEVTAYQKEYRDILQSMLESQGITEFSCLDDIPEIGVIASESATHIAMGFLRMVEGGFAQIDGLTSNADLPSNLRHEALDLIISSLVNKAKQLKLKGIISFTREITILKRAEAHSFHLQPDKVISLSFKE